MILDEVGRGTSTWDGMSIAWAILEHLHHDCRASRGGTPPRVLFATHYHELTCLEERLKGVKNFSMAVSEGSEGILFLHQVTGRPADRSYGIEVARLAGLPKPVLRRAFELLELFERAGFERSSVPVETPSRAALPFLAGGRRRGGGTGGDGHRKHHAYESVGDTAQTEGKEQKSEPSWGLNFCPMECGPG